MKKFVIAAVVAATATLGIAQTAPKGDGDGAFHHRRHRGARMHRIAEKLNLTDAQKEQIKSIRAASREQNKQLFADFKAKRQELRSLRQNNDPRAADVKSQLEAMRPQLEAARKATHEQVLSVLTAEQRAQLEQWKTQRQQRRGERQ